MIFADKEKVSSMLGTTCQITLLLNFSRLVELKNPPQLTTKNPQILEKNRSKIKEAEPIGPIGRTSCNQFSIWTKTMWRVRLRRIKSTDLREFKGQSHVEEPKFA